MDEYRVGGKVYLFSTDPPVRLAIDYREGATKREGGGGGGKVGFTPTKRGSDRKSPTPCHAEGWAQQFLRQFKQEGAEI